MPSHKNKMGESMRLFLALFMIITAASVNAQTRNYVDATGTVVQRYKEFVPGGVINSASATLSAGYFVCSDLTADDGVSVDLCAAAGNKALCMITDDSCSVGEKCTCQTKGYVANAEFALISAVNATAGAVVYASVDGKVYAIGDAAPLDHANKFPVGVALDAASAAGDLEVYLDL